MIVNNIAHRLLFEPIEANADTLLILSGYASPNMASWLIQSYREKKMSPIDIRLVVGMTVYDGISISAHEGFKELQKNNLGNDISRFKCSYVCEGVPVHANLYIWMKRDVPFVAFTGSPDFLQGSFLAGRREVAEECDAVEAKRYFDDIEGNSVFCNHGEVDDFVIIHKSPNIIDEDGKITITGKGIHSATLSLLSKNGDTGEKSGLNWGQRGNRNRNEAYIPLPKNIAIKNFFPLEKKHFIARTDDGHTLVLRVEQDGNKAITTPLSNAQLGEYFRNRLNLAYGAYVHTKDLLDYGRTDVTFYKIDEEEFFLDFSVQGDS